MSNLGSKRPRLNFSARYSLAIVASQYNQEFVTGLTDGFKKELAELAPRANVALFEVPGAFEIPLILQELAAQGAYDAIVAFGVIIKGETAHADLIGRSVTDALQDIALRFSVPVIHEVLLVENEEQARARTLAPVEAPAAAPAEGEALPPASNRGAEAARAAMRVLETLSEIRKN